MQKVWDKLFSSVLLFFLFINVRQEDRIRLEITDCKSKEIFLSTVWEKLTKDKHLKWRDHSECENIITKIIYIFKCWKKNKKEKGHAVFWLKASSEFWASSSATNLKREDHKIVFSVVTLVSLYIYLADYGICLIFKTESAGVWETWVQNTDLPLVIQVDLGEII